MPNTLKIVPRIYDNTTLDFCVGSYKLYRFSSLEKTCPAPSSIFVTGKDVRQPWNACQYSHKYVLFSSKFVHIKCCTAPQIHIVRTVFPCCLLPFLKLDLSPSLALQKNEMNHLSMVCPHTLIDLMLGRWGVSHPMVEIGLDGWLRLNVSSLTPSLKS